MTSLPLTIHGDPVAAPSTGAPEFIGILAGTAATYTPADTKLFGTDLGMTFEHDGQLYIAFGDTWDTREILCNDPEPHNDDAFGTLPLQFTGSVPSLHVFTQASDATMPDPLQIFRGTDSLKLGWLQVPVGGFSDGQHMYMLFDQTQPQTCDDKQLDGTQLCPVQDKFICATQLGVCDPPDFADDHLPCDAVRQVGCTSDQKCMAEPLCLDTTNSQYDNGSYGGLTNSDAHRLEIGIQRDSNPVQFDDVWSWPTRKFLQPAMRTVMRFSGGLDGNDYRPGTGSLFVWGRPGFIAQKGREAQLYLMQHDLPLDVHDGQLHFAPHYFAGIDPTTQAPLWSDLQSDAKPIALDGLPGGDPHETVEMVGQTTVSWLPDPINKWMMLYGADPVDEIVNDPGAVLPVRARGSVVVRYADHPWGPFSPASPLLSPGDPQHVGDLEGPGGLLYNPDCVSTANAMCVPRGAVRPADTVLPDCPPNLLEPDPGRLYAPNIIDSYIQPNAHGGLDVLWNVSLWDPYSVALFKTEVNPPSPAPAGSELADARGLQRMSGWRHLPELDDPRALVRQSSRARANNAQAPDVNNFVCSSKDAHIDASQGAAFRFDQPQCDEDYVHGVVLGRFEGPGRLARTWLTLSSLPTPPPLDELLRIYVDDDPKPRVEVPLADAISGRAGEIFARPFGAGSKTHLAWYYPVAFQHKLIIALDGVHQADNYAYECDSLHDDAVAQNPLPDTRLPARDRVFTQLDAVYHPALGSLTQLSAATVQLAAGQNSTLHVDGPATVYEAQLSVTDANLPALANTTVTLRWEGQSTAAIDVPLSELFGYDDAPPTHSSLALTSFEEGGYQVLSLKLPMPFTTAADWSFENHGTSALTFDLALSGEQRVPSNFGHLHVQRSETQALANASEHVAVNATGRGRLVGLCEHTDGDVEASNATTPDVRIEVDGSLWAEGTGTDHYVDDALGFEDGPNATPFVQTWNVTQGTGTAGRANFCRWNVLGTELDFSSSVKLSFDLARGNNPARNNHHRSVAYFYLAD